MADVWFRADKSATTSGTTGIQGKVSGLVDAMAAYSDQQAGATPGTPLLQQAVNGTQPLGSMAAALGSFDANGNFVVSGSAQAECCALGHVDRRAFAG